MSAARRKRFADLFGHLTIRYTRQRAYTDFKGSKQTKEYELIGVDADSVAIMSECGWSKQRSIYHIHFDGDRHYWISLGDQREWFRRIQPRQKTPAKGKSK
jgi:hypothetical protein